LSGGNERWFKGNTGKKRLVTRDNIIIIIIIIINRNNRIAAKPCSLGT
jgi:hypothetical protein